MQAIYGKKTPYMALISEYLAADLSADALGKINIRNSIRCKYLHSIKHVAVGDAGKYFKCTGQPQDSRLGETSDALFLPSLCRIGLGMHSTELVLPCMGSQGTLPQQMERNWKRLGVRN